MFQFSTQFPVKANISNSDFSKLAVKWLKGVERSTVLENTAESELYDDDAKIQAENGEKFSLKSVDNEDYNAIGLRHELPDEEGRLWCTECVLSRYRSGSAFVKVVNECILSKPDATPIQPKRPFLVKMMLSEKWPTLDGGQDVISKPYFLTEKDWELATRIVLGHQEATLPIVYVSRDDSEKMAVNVNKLAFELGGLAHVFVEPSREFSTRLLKTSYGHNPYGGTIAICLPNIGVKRKFFKRSKIDTSSSIIATLVKSVIQYLVTIDGAKALNWRQIQELQAKNLRRDLETKLKDVNSDSQNSLNEYIDLFDTEISEKEERISQLEKLLEDALKVTSEYQSSESDWLNSRFIEDAVKELYSGEVADRVRKAIFNYLNQGALEKNNREQFVLMQVLEHCTYSGGSIGLVNQIKSAGRDSSSMAMQLGQLLCDFGFKRSSDGKHFKFTPSTDLGGLAIQVMAKTTSDHRAGKNKASDIIKDFAISGLDKDV